MAKPTRTLSFCLSLVLAFCVCAPLPALAANFSIRPLKLELSAVGKSGSFEITNSGAQAVTVQSQAFRWVQGDDGNFSFEPAEGLVIFPKLLTIPAGQKMTLRAGYQSSAPLEGEQFFRVLVKELPITAAEPGNITPDGVESGIKMALQLSVPIVVAPAAVSSSKPAIAVEDVQIVQRQLKVGIRNTGQRHVQLGEVDIHLLDESGTELGKVSAKGSYVLPGKRAYLSVPLDGTQCKQTAAVTVAATLDRLPLGGTGPVGGRDCTPPTQKTPGRPGADGKPPTAAPAASKPAKAPH